MTTSGESRTAGPTRRRTNALQANRARGGRVHVVQMAGESERPAFGETVCGQSVEGLGLRILERVSTGEVQARATNGADWCKNCLRWVARW